jgi:hypothetical protein
MLLRARLIEEHERACDEQVPQMAGNPQTCAERILSVEAPLPCVSGGRVEGWRPCSVGSVYPLLPVSVGSASLTEP